MSRLPEKLLHSFGLDEPKRTKNILIYAAVLLAGSVVGAAAAGTLCAGNENDANAILGAAVDIYASHEFGRIFLNSLATTAVFFAICFVSGFFAFGMALSAVALFIRGLALGMTAGVLCCCEQLGGLTFCLAGMLPGGLISGVTLCYMAAVSCDNSGIYLNMFFKNGKRRSPGKPPIPGYCLGVVLMALSAFIDGLAGYIFGNLL